LYFSKEEYFGVIVNKEDKKKIEEIKNQIQCEKKFICTKFDLDNLCKAKFYFDHEVLTCLEETETCSFAESSSSKQICKCPLRKYIAMNLAKWTSLSGQLNGDI
jgi:hypothetical protein